MSSTTTPTAGRPLEGWLLLGTAAVAVAAELLVAILPTLGASDGVRTALAALALLVVTFVGGVAVARSTLHPVVFVLSLPVTVLYAYTGLLLPWTRLSFWLGQVGIELALSVPVLGTSLARLLFGGYTLGQSTLEHALFVHRLMVVAAVALVVVSFGWSRAVSTPRSRSDAQD